MGRLGWVQVGAGATHPISYGGLGPLPRIFQWNVWKVRPSLCKVGDVGVSRETLGASSVGVVGVIGSHHHTFIPLKSRYMPVQVELHRSSLATMGSVRS